MEIAKTILSQLGGYRFIAMTGSKDFLAGDNSLTFRVGRNSAGINGVRIELTPSDTYTMEFIKLTKAERKVVARVEDVYCDQLQDMFLEHTGLYTRL